MSDLIGRQNAIKAVCNAVCECDVPHYPDCDQIKYCDEIQALISLPSTEPKMGWILVSERLPKECDGYVLISKEDGQVTKGLHSEFGNVWYIGDMCGVGGCKVIAWMPLPKPYKTKVKDE